MKKKSLLYAILLSLLLIVSLLYFLSPFFSRPDDIKKPTIAYIEFSGFYEIARDPSVFFKDLRDFTRVAVESLGMNFINHSIVPDTAAINESLIEFLIENRPDAVIFVPSYPGTTMLLDAVEALRIPAININGPLSQFAGKPRIKYRYWIGQVIPDEADAGRRLADRLIQEALTKSSLPVIYSFPGTSLRIYSTSRTSGFNRAIRTYPDLKHVNLSYNFSRFDRSRIILSDEFKPSPGQISVVWCDSDMAALGVVSAARQMGLVPGENVITGGVDAISEAVSAVSEGSLTATAGGHFTDGAAAAVLIYDFLHGKDFLAYDTEFKTRMVIIDRKNLNKYRAILNRKNWPKINFKSLSMQANEARKSYSFSIEVLAGSL